MASNQSRYRWAPSTDREFIGTKRVAFKPIAHGNESMNDDHYQISDVEYNAGIFEYIRDGFKLLSAVSSWA